MDDTTTTTIALSKQQQADKLSPPTLIGVLGTGQYASAITQRLVPAGFSVALGSRSPQRRRASLPWNDNRRLTTRDPGLDLPLTLDDKVKVVSLEECMASSEVVIVALHREHFEKIFTRQFAPHCAGKILVDVSNRTTDRRRRCTNSLKRRKVALRSNAQQLADMVPGARVVKAFNGISAYVMENEMTTGGTRAVAVASDDYDARRTVCALAKEIGFEPEDCGGLRNAWFLEEKEMKAFPEWRWALLTTLGLLLFWTLFAITRFYWIHSVFRWDQIPLKVLNKVFGATTLTLLALTYMPSTCAACLQMAYGTKHRRFPRWMDAWLKARKQLGLLAFAAVCVHAIMSALLISPSYMASWFTTIAPAKFTITATSNVTQELTFLSPPKMRMTWIGELSLLAGVVAFGMMALLALTSLPAVTRALNWAEWRLVHARLSYVMLTLAVMHVYVMGVPKWVKTGFPGLLIRIKFMSVGLPTAVLLSRVFLLLPCVAAYLRRIRMGWERKTTVPRIQV